MKVYKISIKFDGKELGKPVRVRMTIKKSRPVVKYRHTESGEVKTKAQWLRELAPVAADHGDAYEFSALDLFNAEVADGKLIQVRG